MNFQQLRIIRETVRHNFNLTAVAQALATSQSGVSRHIRDLEEELGVELFVRRGKRLLALTDPGRQILPFVERMLVDAGSIGRIGTELGATRAGELVIATTHTQARYMLPGVIAEFRRAFPEVRLVLHQTSPADVAQMLLDGRADLGIATEALSNEPDLAAFAFHVWRHGVIVPKGHALATASPLTLEALAAHPLITYQQGFTGRPAIDRAFSGSDIAPDIVLEAIDADVIKAYVELGLGVGIVAEMAFDPARDSALVMRPERFFEETTTYLAVRRGRFLRGFAYRFIEACRPELTEALVRREAGVG
ncbi:MAG: transcriptional regulator [Methylobacterium sp.]|nr:MAG: transcriptional regulator [Methylobacterium sp.]